MSQFCASPSVKKDEGLLDVHQVHIRSSANETAGPRSNPSQGVSWLIYAWLGLLTLMATAALIMAAWNTANHSNHDTIQEVVYTSPTPSTSSTPSPTPSSVGGDEPVALVTNPKQAIAQGWKLEGNLYAGTGYWGTKSNMATPRADHGVTHYNGLIYVFGGMNYDPSTNASVVLSSMNSYNMYDGTVTPLRAMPQARTRFAYAIAQDKLYVFGGFNSTAADGAPSASTMVYSFASGKWADMDSSMDMKFPRVDHAGASAGDKVYAVGGFLNGYEVTAAAEVLDPATNKWSQIPSMAIPRADGSAQGVNGILYVLGGSLSNNDADGYTGAVEAYDPSTGVWSTKANMTYSCGQYAAEVLKDGNILVAGGEGDFAPGQKTIPWVQLYITAVDAWVLKAAMIEPRYRFDMATAHGNFVYAFGGALNCDRPSDDSSPLNATDCPGQVYSTILGFYDNQYPNVWVATTQDNN